MKARSGVQIFAGARGQAGQTLRRRQKQRTKFSQGGTYDRVVDMASVSNHKWMCAVYMSILGNAVCPNLKRARAAVLEVECTIEFRSYATPRL